MAWSAIASPDIRLLNLLRLRDGETHQDRLDTLRRQLDDARQWATHCDGLGESWESRLVHERRIRRLEAAVRFAEESTASSWTNVPSAK